MLTLTFTSKKMANVSRFKVTVETYFKLLNGIHKIEFDFCFNAILS